MSLDHIASERFIHDDLLNRAEALIEEARIVWKKHQKLDPYAITWPSETIHLGNGDVITGSVVCPLSVKDTEAQRFETLRTLVSVTKAYGLLVLEPRKESVRVLFETHHGARAWTLPLKRHGDVWVLGPAEVRDGGECIGLLWQRVRGSS